MDGSGRESKITEGDPVIESGEVTSRARLRIAEVLQKPFDVRSIALTGLFILAVFYTIYFLRSVLLPIVLALLLSYLLRPIVRALSRIKIPTAVWRRAYPDHTSCRPFHGGFGAGRAGRGLVSESARRFGGVATQTLTDEAVDGRSRKSRRRDREVSYPRFQHQDGGRSETSSHHGNTLHAHSRVHHQSGFTSDSALLSLAYDGVFIGKLIKLLPTLSDKKRAVSIAQEIELQVSRYLFTVTIINCCLGLAVGTTVGLLGLRNPVMWGAMVAILNFVPYLGALTGIICMTIGAILSFDSLGYALIFPAVYLGFGTLEGNFITPWVMGRSLTLNPVLILLSLVFWGWMWGIAGVILAVPILAAFKIFCAHIKPMEPLAEFLS